MHPATLKSRVRCVAVTLFVWGLMACMQPLRTLPRSATSVGQDVSIEAMNANDWARLLTDSKAPAPGVAQTKDATAAAGHLSSADVVLSAPLADHAHWRLVWLKTWRTPSRTTGPLALVFIHPRRIDVLAMGTMSLPHGDVSLRYVDMHEFFAVRADVTQCQTRSGKPSSLCSTTMRLLPNIDGSLLGGVEQQHEIALDATHTLGDGGRLWSRQIDSHADVELCQGTIILTEWAVLNEYHRKRLRLPPREVRRAGALRSLRWELGSWQASDAPLWQMMAQAERSWQR